MTGEESEDERLNIKGDKMKRVIEGKTNRRGSQERKGRKQLRE